MESMENETAEITILSIKAASMVQDSITLHVKHYLSNRSFIGIRILIQLGFSGLGEDKQALIPVTAANTCVPMLLSETIIPQTEHLLTPVSLGVYYSLQGHFQ